MAVPVSPAQICVKGYHTARKGAIREAASVLSGRTAMRCSRKSAGQCAGGTVARDDRRRVDSIAACADRCRWLV